MDLIEPEHIENKIFTLRGKQLMLDSDLALLYGTETKFINRAVKRNPLRFPESFVFQLTEKEWKSLRFQIGTSSDHGGRRFLPHVFTEQGVAMLSSVLNTETAIHASIQIMQAFVNMRKFLIENAFLFQRLDQMELKQMHTDAKIERIFKAMEAGQLQAEKGIFFDGQVFDAYAFVCDLIKKAKQEILLMDNYVDESVLTLLAKRNKGVALTIYTKNISKTLQLDVQKHEQQYPPIRLKRFEKGHDRFLVIDGKRFYHIGASLKDLGKKWFAFSQMDELAPLILSQLKTIEKK